MNLDFDARSIQIEMAGRNDDAVFTGAASPELAAAVETTAEKTIQLVLALRAFLEITIENTLGHQQINTGNHDLGVLFVKEIFPQLLKAILEECGMGGVN